MKTYQWNAALVFALFLAAPAQGSVVNGSFEFFDAGTGSGSPATYPYPEVTDWIYTGSPTTSGLLGTVSETLGTIPLTPHGDNWLLVDSRIGTQHIYQPFGTIVVGQSYTVSALIGRPTNAEIADFEVAFYRSDAGSGTPDVFLAAIDLTSNPGLAGLAAGATAMAEAGYIAEASDEGETLFVRIGRLSGGSSPVRQAVVDNVGVSVITGGDPPTLSSITDDQGGGPVAVDVPIFYTVLFSKDMDDATVDTTDFDTSGTATTTVDSVNEVSPGEFEVQVTPSTAGTVQLLIPAGAVLSDTATPANNLDTTTDLLDDTIITVDGTSPMLVPPTSPADGATGVSIVSSFTATFDEDIMLANGGVITIRNLGPGEDETIILPDTRVFVSGDTLSISSIGYLEPSTAYAIQIDGAAVTDAVGNPFAGILDDTSWSFSTDSETTGPLVIPLSNPDFEADTVADGTTLGTISGWNNATSTGVINPAAGVGTPVSGENVAFTDRPDRAVYQRPGHHLLANSRYTLTIHVGRPIGQAAQPTWRTQMVTSPDGTTSISDYCQLLSGGATSTLNGGTAASGVDPGETTQGELRQVTLIWETGSSPSGLGDPLFVRFFCDGTVGGGDRAFWDDVELTVEPLGSFSSWIANFAGLGGQTGIDDDPDGDGNDNGVENYFGTNPGEFSGGIVAGVVDKGANTFTFTHPLNDTPASDLTVTYRWSTDLVNFHDDEATNGGGTTTVDFSDPVPAGDTFSVTASISGTVIPDKLFVVIEVTQN